MIKKIFKILLVLLIAIPFLALAQVRTFTSEQEGTSVTNGDLLQTNGSVSTWVSPASLGITGMPTSTNPSMATYFVATSTTATSTLPNLETTNLKVTGTFYVGSTIFTGFTQGSAIFAGASGLLSEDNANFNFNDTANRFTTVYASSTAQTISGNLYLNTLNGPLDARNGAVGATTTIGATYGGTGQTTVTTGDILYGSATNIWSKLAGVATGNALISGGVATAPSWGKIGLTTHVSGTLPIANGGTNATSFTTSGNAVYYDGSALLTAPLTAPITIPYASTTAVSSSGSAWFATSGGNVGIGTTVPSAKLDVWDSANTPTSIGDSLSMMVGNDGGAANTLNSQIGFGYLNRAGASQFAPGVLGFVTNSSSGQTKGDFFFATRDVTTGTTRPTERLRITSAGNVGIGETAPGSKLSVSGGATVGTNYDTITSPTNGLLVEGNIGVGTTTPSLDGDTTVVTVSGGTGTDVVGTLELAGKRSGSDGRPASIVFYNAGNKIARIDSNKNGSSNTQGQLAFTTTLENLRVNPSGAVFNEDSNDIDFRIESDTNANFFNIDGTNVGLLGIGAAPSGASIVDVAGTISSFFTGGQLSALYLSSSISPAASANASLLRVGGTLVEGSGGTHGNLAGSWFSAPTVMPGTSAVTNASTVYIDAAPSATVTGGNYAMYVNSGQSYFGGNVGIGSTTPYSNLSIEGTQTTTGLARLFSIKSGNASSDAALLNISARTDTGATTGRRVELDVLDGGGTARSLILNPSGGSVGIGDTTPDAKLDVHGKVVVASDGNDPAGLGDLEIIGNASGSNRPRIGLSDLAGTGQWLIQPWSTAGDGNLSFTRNAGSGHVVIPSGNVGIGTTTPVSLLDVFSTATSTVKVDSNSATQGGCIILKDTDGVGWTSVTASNGVLTAKATTNPNSCN